MRKCLLNKIGLILIFTLIAPAAMPVRAAPPKTPVGAPGKWTGTFERHLSASKSESGVTTTAWGDMAGEIELHVDSENNVTGTFQPVEIEFYYTVTGLVEDKGNCISQAIFNVTNGTVSQ